MNVARYTPLDLQGGAQIMARSIVELHGNVQRLAEALNDTPQDSIQDDLWVDAQIPGGHLYRCHVLENAPPSYVVRSEGEPGHVVTERFRERPDGQTLRYSRTEKLDGLQIADISCLINRNGTFTMFAGEDETQPLFTETVASEDLRWRLDDASGGFMAVGGRILATD